MTIEDKKEEKRKRRIRRKAKAKAKKKAAAKEKVKTERNKREIVVVEEDDIIIEVGADIVWRATVDGFPDTQRGPEWVTEILNKVVGAEEEKEVIEPENQEVIN